MKKKDYKVVFLKKKDRSRFDASDEKGGGAWKIAYSDFITTLMAFFMLLWLLNSTPSSNLKALSEYFKNMKVGIFNYEYRGDAATSPNNDNEDGDFEEGQQTKPSAGAAESKMAGKKTPESYNIYLLKRDLDKSIGKDPSLANLRDNIIIEENSNGLSFLISDDASGKIFDTGSANLTQEGINILKKIAPTIRRSNSMLSISGYSGKSRIGSGQLLSPSYAQWSLANDRANAARMVLETSGVSPSLVHSVISYSNAFATESSGIADRKLEIVILSNNKGKGKSTRW